MFGKVRKELYQAIENGDEATLRVVAPNMKEPLYTDCCFHAVETGSVAALKALTAQRKLLFFGSSAYKASALHEMINLAKTKENSGALLSVIATTYDAWDSGVKISEFLDGAQTSTQLLQSVLENEPNNFRTCLEHAGLESTEKLKFILSFAARANNPMPALTDALVKTAADGDVEKIRLLLERGADPNHASGQALKRAAEGNHADAVAALLPVTDLALYGDDILIQLERTPVDGQITEAIRLVTENAKNSATPAAPSRPSSDTLFQRVDADTLVETQTLPDGATLTAVFNFRTAQQKNILDKNNGTSPALTVVGFKDIDPAVIKSLRKTLDGLKP